jgi:hypothetical protein
MMLIITTAVVGRAALMGHQPPRKTTFNLLGNIFRCSSGC